MDTSIKQYTRLVFDHGNLQASPKHIALLNQQPATLFTGRAPTGTTPAGYQVVMTGYANFVYTKERLGRESGRASCRETAANAGRTAAATGATWKPTCWTRRGPAR